MRGQLNIANSTINDSTAVTGGAISNSDGTLNITSTEFSNTSATTGGAVATEGVNAVTTIADSTITGAQADNGGGFAGLDGTTIINGTLFDQNTATALGGGIYNVAALTVDQFTVLDGNDAVDGGGIYNTGTLQISDVTLTYNLASQHGAGIYQLSGTLDAQRSLLSYNTATNLGGGAYLNTAAQFENTTFSENIATDGGALAQIAGNTTIAFSTFFGSEGTTALLINGGTVSTTVSLFAGSTGANCDAAVASTGYNMSDDASCNFAAIGDRTQTDPLLEALADNDANVRTHKLTSVSPALDAVPVGDCSVTEDQRGLVRPAAIACDIGAYEEQNRISQGLVVNTPDPAINADGLCSFVEAVVNANDNAATHADCAAGNGADTIILTQTTYRFTSAYDTTIAAIPNISDELTIQGNNAIVELDSGVMGIRFMYVAASGTVNVEALTFQNWHVTGANDGGVIYNDGVVNLSNTVLENNIAGDVGGAIVNRGTMTIADSTFRNNTAEDEGGAIYADRNGTLTVTNTLFENNLSNSSYGGAIYVYAVPPTTFDNTTFTGNQARSGGAIYTYPGSNLFVTSTVFTDNDAYNASGGAATIYENASFSRVLFDSNSAITGGGAVVVWSAGNLTIEDSLAKNNTTGNLGSAFWIGNASNATIENTTVTGGNSASDSGAIYVADASTDLRQVTIADNTGTGLFVANTGTVSLTGVLLADNTLLDSTPANCVGAIATSVYSLSSDATCAFSAFGNVTEEDPLLDPLADNGGDTETYALQTASPAIDRVATNVCLVGDQRGVERPQGGACDIGAYEFETTSAPESDLVLSISLDNDAVTAGADVVVTVSVLNNGPDVVDHVAVEYVPPEQVLYLSNTPQQGTYDDELGYWDVGTIASGATVDLTVNVRTRSVLANENIRNEASILLASSVDTNITK